jgi:AmiR/NasT family two-component response regulator
LHDALEAARLEHRTQARRYEEAKSQLQGIVECFEAGRTQREVLHESAVARLQVQLEALPVIEQAKGIIMAQQRCGPQEAFDLLRRECQRANIEVRVLAAQIVEEVASPTPATDARPVQLAASKHA